MESRFRFRFVAPPEDLAPYVNTLFVFETDEARLEDILPAYSAQLMCFSLGEAQLRLADGTLAQSGEAVFLSPMQQASPFSMAGPVRACGISLTTLGWAAVSGLSVDRFGHMRFPASDIVGEEAAGEFARAGRIGAEGPESAEEACALLAETLRSCLRPVSERHRRFIDQMTAWLNSSFNPDIDELPERCRFSSRQVQRLARRYFGRSPSGLVRRYRAIRAATLLSQPGLSAKARDEVVNAFFDQAHMIRDIRHFTGRTPAALGNGAENVTRDTLGPEGYGVIDLFGGTEGALASEEA